MLAQSTYPNRSGAPPNHALKLSVRASRPLVRQATLWGAATLGAFSTRRCEMVFCGEQSTNGSQRCPRVLQGFFGRDQCPSQPPVIFLASRKDSGIFNPMFVARHHHRAYHHHHHGCAAAGSLVT